MSRLVRAGSHRDGDEGTSIAGYAGHRRTLRGASYVLAAQVREPFTHGPRRTWCIRAKEES